MCFTNSVKICESIDKVGKAMPVIVDDATKRRLVYVKKLYLHGRARDCLGCHASC